MQIALFVLAGFAILGALTRIALIGKPREPIEAPAAAIGTLISAFEVFVLIVAALSLH